MSSVSWRTPASAVVTVGAILGLVWATGDLISSISFRSAVVVGAGYALLLSTSGTMVSAALQYAGADVSEKEADTGRAVGKVENILILTLTLLGAYTALGLVFTAKSIVRWQDISSGNTTYYLTGSIANVTYSLVFGVCLDYLLGTF
ncbi:hypothetical protein JZX76_09620 [Haloarcula hispanica]|nr:hypothetical protein [Haloarcula hispanica]